MSHITVLALFEEEPKDVNLAVIEKMEPFEEGGDGPREEWDYWVIEDDNGKPLWRGKARDYEDIGCIFAIIDPSGDWVEWPESRLLSEYGDVFAVEIDAHR